MSETMPLSPETSGSSESKLDRNQIKGTLRGLEHALEQLTEQRGRLEGEYTRLETSAKPNYVAEVIESHETRKRLAEESRDRRLQAGNTEEAHRAADRVGHAEWNLKRIAEYVAEKPQKLHELQARLDRNQSEIGDIQRRIDEMKARLN